MEFEQQRSTPFDEVKEFKEEWPDKFVLEEQPEFAPSFAPEDAPEVIFVPEEQERQPAWYVVIDEMVDDSVTFEAWPWPDLNKDTGYLDFDLEAGKRVTLKMGTLYEVVADLRTTEPTDRPLRIGDCFRVIAEKVRHPTTGWVVLEDYTKWARSKAQAAMYAMAAPTKKREEVEAWVTETAQSEADPDMPIGLTKQMPAADESGRAYPTV